MDGLQIVRVAVIGSSFLPHIISLSLLVTSTNLKQVRFQKLVLSLSISDTLSLAELLIVIILQELSSENTSYIPPCKSLTRFTLGTFVFSLYQCVLICLERLHATFASENAFYQNLTSNKGIVVAFLIFHCVAILHVILDLTTQDNTNGCSAITFTDTLMLILVDIPMVCIYLLMAAVYSVVMVRVMRRTEIKSQNSVQSTNSSLKLQTIVTLTITTALSLLANIPRSVVAFYSLIFVPSESDVSWMTRCNSMILLNFLLDPFIYVFCIKDFRQRLKALFCKTPINVRPIEQQREGL
ncbi:Hypothetical predicted protein [Mytilus galloprovincialis]|uniref:G-protein coupled receptors family 1 profile domain-containing protein n=1 Tax=Mytilus galloprovincialis TaxID=29158 RepID=A0A8B6EEA9_MYTGA|nr:Hypothetical predicted protein [Mytilus galloprovincialis]